MDILKSRPIEVSIKKSKSPDRKKKPWSVRWREGGRGSSQRRRSFATKELASQYRMMVIKELNFSLLAGIKQLKWCVLTEEFIKNRKAIHVSDGQIEQYQFVFNEFSEMLNAPISTNITNSTIEEYLKQLKLGKQNIMGKTRHLSPDTINGKLAKLTALFNWAEGKYIIKQPVLKEHRAKTVKKPPEIWTTEQYLQVESAANDQWRVLMRLAVNGVGRKSSLIKMNIDMVDIKNNRVICYDSKEKDNRITPLNSATMEILSHYINELPKDQVTLFTLKFSSHSWKLLCKRAKVPFIEFHTGLRATMNRWLQKEGVAEGLASRRLGHASPEMTRRAYANFESLDDQREIADKMPI